MSLAAPFPWFGGKRRVAAEVWRMLGDVPSYVEPFFGSGAVLLGRPKPSGVETVNDADGFLANFWRAVQAVPDEVAHYADWPVNEADLHARHLWLVGQRESLTERLMGEADWYDAKAAGWWVWGASAWIGSGWCSGSGPWVSIDGVFVHRQLPHLGDEGQGVHRKLPHLGDEGRGVHRCGIRGLMRSLSERLRKVRVACGDWSRLTGDTVLFCTQRKSGPGISPNATVGIFLDPPYRSLHSIDYAASSALDYEALEAWCREQGARPQCRIVLCGYEGEYDLPGWSVVPWKAHGGYGSQGDGRGRENSERERLWCSPACLRVERATQPGLAFEEAR